MLRYNYDPEGLPQIKIKALDGRVVESLAGPEDPSQVSCDVVCVCCDV